MMVMILAQALSSLLCLLAWVVSSRYGCNNPMSSINLMQEAEKAYEETIHAMLMPSDAATRERFLFSLGYLAGKEAMLNRLANKTSPFSTK